MKSIFATLLFAFNLLTLALPQSGWGGGDLKSLQGCDEAISGRLKTATIKDYYVIKSEVDPDAEFPSFDNKNLAGTFYPNIPATKNFEIIENRAELAERLRATFEIPQGLSIELGTGVRSLLGNLFEVFSVEGYTLLLPEDNYPAYERLAKQAGLTTSSFRTVPTFDLPEQSNSARQALVITSPLSPMGRPLLSEEVEKIERWLSQNSARRVVLDTVYTFSNGFDEQTQALLKNKQVLAVHSFAKSYALPGHLGFAVGNAEIFEAFFRKDNPVNSALASKALAIAKARPDFPEKIRIEISSRWKELAPRLRQIFPDWRAPENGYYSVVPVPPEEILQKHGSWAFPLATFGSQQTGHSVISALPDNNENVFYVTVLSNFARGFDKYSMTYSKAGVPESTFPDQFYLLNGNELEIGIEKARKVLEKTVPGDRILVIGTSERASQLNPNERSGLGRFIRSRKLNVESLLYLNPDGSFTKPRLEDVLSDSLALNRNFFVPIDRVRPRSISILPIASACEACCKFCFSEASISAKKRSRSLSNDDIERAFALALQQGAERAVITGGGEPTLIGFERLNEMAKAAARYFPKMVTLITNGISLAKLDPVELKNELLRLQVSGVSVLAISRHHQSAEKNAAIMGKDTQTERILRVYSENRQEFKTLKIRLICVLQKSGVNSEAEIADYISWAQNQGVAEVNFKELYVSTDRESSYSKSPFNVYSEDNRVYLKTVLDYARRNNWEKTAELPWGAPIFVKVLNGMRMQIAAYTEPSLFWERTHGVARSWNLMADGKLMMSLEDGESEISY